MNRLMNDDAPQTIQNSTFPTRIVIFHFAIELVVYGLLVFVYFYLVLRLLNGVLARLFQTNLHAYGLLGLGLIVAQGLLLELVTSFIVNQLHLERME
jgi:hypothetical protein